jgi:two-component system, NtrC family, nitrogen regulation sensor histidine kinase NtrY
MDQNRSGTNVRFSLSRGVLVALLAAAALLALYLQSPRDDFLNIGDNLTVFFLLNLNIVLLFVLVFLVGRNIVKLIFERRRNKLGSKLQVKLVLALVGLTLVPTVLLFFLASGLLNIAMEGWFSSEAERTRLAAVDVARAHYLSLEDRLQLQGRRVIQDIQRRPQMLEERRVLRRYLAEHRRIGGLYEIEVIHSSDPTKPWLRIPLRGRRFPVDSQAVQDAFAGDERALSEQFGEIRLIRSYQGISVSKEDGVVVILSTRLSPRLAHAFDLVNASYRAYEQLRLFRYPLRSGYLLTLAMVTGMILFAALWTAFYIAKQIVGPVQNLVAATERIARGDYDVSLEVRGEDEMSYLVASFNRMVQDLKTATFEAAQQRIFLEVTLENLAVGVIRVDRDRLVASINRAAAQIFHVDPSLRAVPLTAIIEEQVLHEVNHLLDQLDDEVVVAEGQLRVMSQGRELEVVCTVGKILGESDEWVGTVLLFDDITELSKAQHMAAWREVARRIAHEIKNPLTPIQLSAQRLLRWFSERPGHESLEESAQTIVEHVDSIKRLADEFSHFARMPTAQFESADLNEILADVVASFAERYTDITFQIIADPKMPQVMLDPEQTRRIVINLVDNAVSALYGDVQDGSDWSSAEAPRIVVKSIYDRRQKTALFEVADNGPGILPGDKARIFDPYFTRKEKGTGLGLAIVTSIISDHHGQIRVYDNKPRGAKFIVDLPVTQQTATTQRRFASSVE